MNPVITVAILFWAALIASVVCFANDLQLRDLLAANWKRLAFILLLTLLWRVPADGTFFHGLEYEDSYIYTVAGRQMAAGVEPESPLPDVPYSINVCAIGSLESCQKWEPFREHLIGYPYVISLYSRLFGYTSSAGSLINLAAAGLASLLVFCIASVISRDLNIATVAGSIFACTPVFAVYGLETSAEPFSNLCLALMMWFFLRLCDPAGVPWGKTLLRWSAFSATLLLAQSVKREDLLPALLLPFMTLAILKSKDRYVMGGLVIITSALALLFAARMQLLQTVSGETELVRQFPFTTRRIADFIMAFFRSFIVFDWYAGSAFAVALGFVISCRRKGVMLIPIGLLSAYVLLYAVHIRSHDEMQTGVVEPQAALRFSMNVMAPWAIVAGVGLGSILTRIAASQIWIKRQSLLTWGAKVLVASALVLTFMMTEHLRDYEVEDEMISRLIPAKSAVHLAKHEGGSSDFIVTMEPLVIEMYAGKGVRIADLESVTPDVLQSLLLRSASAQVIFLEETDHELPADISRYGPQMVYLRALPSVVLESNERFRVLGLRRFASSGR